MAGEDFELTLLDDFEINPALIRVLAVDFDVRSAPASMDALVPNDDRVLDPSSLFRQIEVAAARVPGFEIEQRRVLGNFFLRQVADRHRSRGVI